MDKKILEIIADFSQWSGDVYRLATMIAAKQNEIDQQKLLDAEMPEAAEVIAWA